jgi:2-polyprenyl-3-methyl-5-hydroxy-6-metoxy-1,4-benzoquinol methylase
MDGDEMPESKSGQQKPTQRYDANYGNFKTELYAEIRREAYGEDIGQNSWTTAEEQDKFLGWLKLTPDETLLDVACGAGGLALRMAAVSGCRVIGVDLHERAIEAANSMAKERGLAERANFQIANAGDPLPFPDGGFDAVICIDAINHIPDRMRTLADWARVLKPDGKLLFTDPITVTGPLTDNEIRIRSMSGFYLFVPEGFDERALDECGLKMRKRENVTSNMAEIAQRRWTAREARKNAIQEIEGKEGFDEQQEFLATAAKLAKENRLSRFAYLAEKGS